MTAQLIRIGNSRGIRIPQELLRLYNLREGSLLVLEERREGILVRVPAEARGKLPREVAYREMAAESAQREEWSDWDVTSGDLREG